MSRAIDLLLAESFTRLSRRFLKALADRRQLLEALGIRPRR